MTPPLYNRLMKNHLSVLMITKNAEKTIIESLASVRGLAGEIIIVDGGSTDKTIAIAKTFRSTVLNYTGENWGEQCQIGLKKCREDWVLVLDADEVVTKTLAKEIISLINKPVVRENGFIIRFQSHYLGRQLNYGGERLEKMVLFKRKYGLVKQTLVHYFYQIKKGRTGLLKNKILHYSYLSIPQIYLKFTDYAVRMAREKKLSGEKSSFKKIFLYPIHMFWARFIKDQGYKDGLFRLPLDLGFAYMEFITYINLLILSLRGAERRSNLKEIASLRSQ